MKNPKFLLGLIFGLAIIALLIDLPRIPIVYKNDQLKINIDTSIGGYRLGLFGNSLILDFTELKKGLDIEGGVRVVLKANMDKIASTDRDAALESAKTIILRRVDLLGVSEPVVQTSKVGEDYRIIVELPGLSNVSDALATIGQTAQLKFKVLKPDLPYDNSLAQQYYLDPTSWIDSNVTGADLKGADVIFDQSPGSQGLPQIRLNFTTEGREKFSELAKQNIDKPIGLFLDEDQTPISMPVVSPDLAEGLTTDPVINGNFNTQQANSLSVALRAGALPVPVEVVEQKNIGATLGQESIRQSIIAGVIGLLIVFAFMIVCYGRLGVVASIALLIYSVLTIAIFKIVPVVITLPGLAGFVLSIGMAVDANILIFERIKEEVRWGRPFNLALRMGFDRAWPSIRDANISSLITSGILFYFGTGIVRGFALTLAIGIFVSMFTAIIVTRTIIRAFFDSK